MSVHWSAPDHCGRTWFNTRSNCPLYDLPSHEFHSLYPSLFITGLTVPTGDLLLQVYCTRWPLIQVWLYLELTAYTGLTVPGVNGLYRFDCIPTGDLLLQVWLYTNRWPLITGLTAPTGDLLLQVWLFQQVTSYYRFGCSNRSPLITGLAVPTQVTSYHMFGCSNRWPLITGLAVPTGDLLLQVWLFQQVTSYYRFDCTNRSPLITGLTVPTGDLLLQVWLYQHRSPLITGLAVPTGDLLLQVWLFQQVTSYYRFDCTNRSPLITGLAVPTGDLLLQVWLFQQVTSYYRFGCTNTGHLLSHVLLYMNRPESSDNITHVIKSDSCDYFHLTICQKQRALQTANIVLTSDKQNQSLW